MDKNRIHHPSFVRNRGGCHYSKYKTKYSRMCYNVNMEKLESGKFIKSIKSAWEKYEFRLVVALILALIAIISFEAGYVKGGGQKIAPMVIEKPSECPEISPREQDSAIMEKDTVAVKKAASEPILKPATDMDKCLYVGSKNSDKYYPPTCSYAKRVKSENLVCFQTEAEALAENRTRSTGCKY